MRKLTTSVRYVLNALLYINGNESRNIGTSTSSVTLEYHWFEVVTFEILDFEGHKYEEVDYFSWRCALGPQ